MRATHTQALCAAVKETEAPEQRGGPDHTGCLGQASGQLCAGLLAGVSGSGRAWGPCPHPQPDSLFFLPGSEVSASPGSGHPLDALCPHPAHPQKAQMGDPPTPAQGSSPTCLPGLSWPRLGKYK